MKSDPTAGFAPESSQPRAPRAPLAFAQKIYYGLGALLAFSGAQMLMALTFPIYNIELGVDPTLLGLAIMFGRIWDTVSDPAAGVISDNTRSRFGRRRPYLFVGSLLCMILFPLIFFVDPAWTEQQQFVFYSVTSILFLTAYTIYSVPYWALGSEMTPDYNERTKVVAIRTMIGMVGANIIAAWAYRLTQLDIFESALVGVRYVSIGLCAILALFGIVTAFKTQEPYFKVAKTQKKVGFWESIRGVFTNDQAMIVLIVFVISNMGNALVHHLGIYVNTYYIFGGDTKMAASYVAIGGTIGAFISFFSIQPLARISEKIGKRQMMNVCFIMGITGSILKYFCYSVTLPWLQFIPVILLTVSGSGVALMISSIKADVVDYDEMKCGLRREGAFGSAFGYINKGVSAFTALLAGVLLSVSGFNQALGADQDDGAILALRLMFAVIPAVFFVIAYFLLRYYKLTEAQITEIREELEARRGEV
ncbi:MFS transporter [Coraliomargarita sp. SDUM461004]|uniref:MFS transporter n=1 Tax=Thalassobacterium sedimentorum TaxID=3041258 RepID=A0ABU1AHB4_9BACT|nr:MFS transporter [Coraliomargarita sp. SDUM461004]MDQ8193028.1 MFS transporter [Coraliomargarita sp. SDUM461004]